MDDVQLHRLYMQESRYHDNPPSFAAWRHDREERLRQAAERAKKALSDPDLMKLLKGWKS